MQWWFRKFSKGDKSLEGEEHSGWPLEVGNNQLRTIIEAGPFTTAQEAAKQLNINHSVVIGHLKQTGKVKKPHELIGNIKYCHSEVSFSLILHNNEPFLNQIAMCDEKWIVYGNQQWPAQCLDQKEAPKDFSKQICTQKNAMVTVWWSAVHLTPYSFLNPGETILSEKYAQQINEMHWKLQHLQLALINTNGPILHNIIRLHIAQPTNVSEVEQIRFASLATFAWPLPNWL